MGEPERLAIVGGDEFGERDDILGQRRQRDDVVDRLHALALDARRRHGVDDDADVAAIRKAHAHDRAASNADAVGDPVVERLAGRRGQRNARDRHDTPGRSARIVVFVILTNPGTPADKSFI